MRNAPLAACCRSVSVPRCSLPGGVQPRGARRPLSRSPLCRHGTIAPSAATRPSRDSRRRPARVGCSSRNREEMRTDMLSPRESTTRERISLDGLWRFALDPRGAAGPSAGGRARCRATARCPCRPASTTSCRTREARDHVGDVWYQRTVRVPRGWDGRADRPALRRRHAPGGRWVGDDAGRRARGRLHAVRGRRHRARPRGRGGARDGRGQQRAAVDVDPAGLRAGARRRPPRAAVLPRLLQLRGIAPVGVAARDAARARQRRHGHARPRSTATTGVDRLPGRRRGRRASTRCG